MDLWIRSQDREKLVKVDDIAINGRVIEGYFDKNTEYEDLGVYKSKERALEVLDEIQNLLMPKKMIQCVNLEPVINDLVYIPNEKVEVTPLSNIIVYEMPKE